jgi:hypothetical protein
MERMLLQLQSNPLHANDLFSVTKRNKGGHACSPREEEEEDKHSSQCEEEKAPNTIIP